jgi:putative transposase
LIDGYEISPETVSKITDSVIDKAREWQVRSLQAVYPIVFMDGLGVKMRNERHVCKMSVYATISLRYVSWKERRVEDALLKVLYLAIRDMSKRWTQKTHN